MSASIINETFLQNLTNVSHFCLVSGYASGLFVSVMAVTYGSKNSIEFFADRSNSSVYFTGIANLSV